MGGGNKPAPETEELTPSRLDMRVGKIVELSRHPDAEKLYVSKIDLGEAVTRTIVSGLVDFVPEAEMQGGMVLCSSRDEPKEVEPLGVPSDCVPGDRVSVEGREGVPDEVLNPKKKVWEKLSVDLATNGEGLAQWQGNRLQVEGKGLISVQAVKGAPIK